MTGIGREAPREAPSAATAGKQCGKQHPTTSSTSGKQCGKHQEAPSPGGRVAEGVCNEVTPPATHLDRDIIAEAREAIGVFGDPAELVTSVDIDAARGRVARLVRRPGWMARAACIDHPLDWWFPTRGESAEPAKSICAECSVLASCRSWSLDQPASDQHGIAAGLTARQRVRLIRQRRRNA